MYFDRQGRPITVTEWGRAFEDFPGRLVQHTVMPDSRVEVLTVWLGVDPDLDYDMTSEELASAEPRIFGSVILVDQAIVKETLTPTEEAARTAHAALVEQAATITLTQGDAT